MQFLIPSPARLRIIFTCVGIAISYGIIHDQVTIRICPEYFTVFHPFLITTSSLTVLALAWGVVATWWMGAVIGIIISAAAQFGSWPKLFLSDIVKYIYIYIVCLGILALTFGMIGYFGSSLHLISPPIFVTDYLEPSDYPYFMAAWYMHIASYFAGGFGALILAGFIVLKRKPSASQHGDHHRKNPETLS